MKKLFKFYPDKTKKPTMKSVLIGALYDFGWIVIIWLVYVVATYQDAPTSKIFVTDLQAYSLLLAIVCGQFIILEALLSWFFYYLSNKKVK